MCTSLLRVLFFTHGFALQGSICATRNYDAFLEKREGGKKALDYYALTKVVPADDKLSQMVLSASTRTPGDSVS